MWCVFLGLGELVWGQVTHYSSLSAIILSVPLCISEPIMLSFESVLCLLHWLGHSQHTQQQIALPAEGRPAYSEGRIARGGRE